MKTIVSIEGIDRRRAPPEGREDDADDLAALESRVGRAHLQQRLEREAEHERRVRQFRAGFFHVERWYSVHSVIRNSLRLVGLHGRARRNARAIRLTHNEVTLNGLPRAFDGYTILHITDPHVDLGPDIPDVLIERVRGLDYDLCVLTGDYRTSTFGPYAATLDGMARIRPYLKGPVYAVLGNHDTIRMVPSFERLGIRVLLNETVALERRGQRLHLAGIDDAHQYRLHDFAKVTGSIPAGEPALLLSHTPEAYAEAARAGFRFMLCGHTHGGQICLPGGFPIIIDASCPRRLARGAWRYGDLVGYTSVGSGASIVDVRLNCPPEVTLHRLRVG